MKCNTTVYNRITVSSLFILAKETKPNLDDGRVAPPQSVKPTVVR